MLQEKYQLHEPINASMYRATDLRTKKQMAIKNISFKHMNQKQKQKLILEVNTLTSHKSKYIIKYYNYLIDKKTQNIHIAMEFCEDGSLNQFLKTRRTQGDKYLSEKAIWNIFSKVVIAIYEIHNDKKGTIVHRNIKPSSILLSSANEVKLGNFGFAKRLNEEDKFAQTVIFAKYISPQQLTSGIYTIQTDVWALGCLLYELATLRQPFCNQNQFERAEMIKNGKLGNIPGFYSRELHRVIAWCLEKNYKDRPTTKQLISIPEINMRLRNDRIAENQKIYLKKKQQIVEREERIKAMKQEIKQLEAMMDLPF